MDIADKNNVTICQLLIRLYKKAILSGRTSDADEITECIIMAKKMHKRLVEYKYPTEVQFEEEEDWRKEIMDLYSQRESWL